MKFMLMCGQFSKPPLSVRASVIELQKKYRPHIWMGTEYQDMERAEQFSTPGYVIYKDWLGPVGLKELLIMVKKRAGRVIEHGTVISSHHNFQHEGGSLSGPRGLCFVKIKRRFRGNILVATQHLANTHGNEKFGHGPRVITFKEQVDFTVNFVREEGADCTSIVLGFDWNTRLDTMNEMSAYLDVKMRAAGLHLVPTRGIEGYYVRGIQLKKSETIPSGSDSDHPKKFLKGRMKSNVRL